MEYYFKLAKDKIIAGKHLILTYMVVYFIWGICMNYLGSYMEIARFTYWWQVMTCYLLYMIPISLLLRGLPLHTQYAYGLVAMCLLEFGGYALKTSYAYKDNVLDRVFSPQNFSLGMALFFAFYFPIGNAAVATIYKYLVKGGDK